MRHAPINLQNRFTYLEKRMAYRLKQLPFQCWDLMSSRLPQHLHLFPINGNCSLELWSIRLRRNGIHTDPERRIFGESTAPLSLAKHVKLLELPCHAVHSAWFQDSCNIHRVSSREATSFLQAFLKRESLLLACIEGDITYFREKFLLSQLCERQWRTVYPNQI